MISKKLIYILIILIPFLYAGCKAGSGLGGLNFFSIQDDIKLGAQVSQQIASDPKQFPILKERGNEKLYRYVRGITTKILNSGQVKHKDDFKWQVKIINDSKTLNAFCTPGGYIYVYTGLIKFLDSEDQLAGVMGHEIAHADLRHSTRQMTKIYGLQTLLQIATGKSNPGMIEKIALGLVNLKFSRGHETESDNNSVKYLCATNYNASGAAGFFKKMEGRSNPPEFMSTHPSPENRVKKIEQKAVELSCRGKNKNTSVYSQMKKLIK